MFHIANKETFVIKPWGGELIWANTDHYIGKILFIEKGKRLSLQKHENKHETLFLVEGKAIVTIEGEQTEIGPGIVIEIPPGTVHRIKALERCEFLEVSTAHMNDIIRLEDDYGRYERT